MREEDSSYKDDDTPHQDPDDSEYLIGIDDPAKKGKAVAESVQESLSDSNLTTPSRTLRSTFGKGTTHLSDWINDNLIVARYGVIASIGLLAAYGVSQSPLFFRYRTIAEIPSQCFRKRRSLSGYLMKVAPQSPGCSSVQCFVRHLSPWEALLPSSVLESVWRLHPGATIAPLAGLHKPQEDPKNLLQVQLIGIEVPDGRTSVHQHNLRRVSCQLLARGTQGEELPLLERSKRPIPELADESEKNTSTRNQVAFVKMTQYNAYPFVWGEDIGESMVKNGEAVVADTGLFGSKHWNVTEVGISQKKDVEQYLSSRLVRAEFEACANYRGVWAHQTYRDSREDFVKDVVFEKEARWWEKVWKWIRDR